MKHPLVEKLEKRLLPKFEEVAERIGREIPNVSAKIESHSFGFNKYLGHSFGISCLLIPVCGETDNVALTVSLSNLVATPKIDAGVGWGHPSGYIEADFPMASESSIEASEENLDKLYQDLPRLYESLFEALRRRKPHDL
jgi:hypothetical protein